MTPEQRLDRIWSRAHIPDFAKDAKLMILELIKEVQRDARSETVNSIYRIPLGRTGAKMVTIADIRRYALANGISLEIEPGEMMPKGKAYMQRVVCSICGTPRDINRQAKTKRDAKFWCEACHKTVEQR